MMPAAAPPSRADAPPLFAQVFRARIHEIRHVLMTVERHLSLASPDLASRTELVLAELLSNIQQHGAMKGPARVSVRLFGSAANLQAEVIDDGCPLPQDCLMPIAPAPVSLPESGFGWLLVHLLVTDLHYRRGEGYNALRFRIPP